LAKSRSTPEEPSLIRAASDRAPSDHPGMTAVERATAEAMRVLHRCVDAAPFRPPHLPIDMLLQLAERIEIDQARLRLSAAAEGAVGHSPYPPLACPRQEGRRRRWRCGPWVSG
jgi:hypothetical protein